MFACRGLFGSSVLKPNLSNHSLSDINAGDSDAKAYVIFGNDGQLLRHTDFSGDSFYTDEWLTGVVTSAEAALYEVVVAVTAGSLDYGTAGTFNLGSARQFGCQVPTNGGQSSATITAQIRRVSDSLVMASATIDFSAVSSNL